VRALLAAVLLLAACAAAPASPGTVVDKVYTPPVSGSGYGFGTCSGSGGTGTCSGVVFYSEPERWTLIVRGDDGRVRSQPVTPEEWAAAEPGTRWPPGG
jgi:hypothetical protein